MTIELRGTCEICGIDFSYTKEKPSKPDIRTCSKKCSYSLRSLTRKTLHEPVEKLCVVCNISFDDTSKKKSVKKCKKCTNSIMVQTRKERGNYERSNLQNEKLSATLKEKYRSGWNPNTIEHREKLSANMQQRWKSGEMRLATTRSCIERYGVDHWTKSPEGRLFSSNLHKGRIWPAEVRENMSKGHQKSFLAGRKIFSRGKGGTRDDIGFYVRSRWEANFARICIYEKREFKYEPESFQLKNFRFYIPDFFVDGVYYELKGYMNKNSALKIEEFKNLYPEIVLKIIGPEEYSDLRKKYKNLINWEE